MTEGKVVDRFLRYVSYETTSDGASEDIPSNPKEAVLAKALYEELRELGVDDVYLDEIHFYVYAKLKANSPDLSDTIGFVAHMDTSPDASGENVKASIVKDYDGGDIVLNSGKNIVLSPDKFPNLKKYEGKSLIVTDGTTLLGADDKAGVAEIMTMLEYLCEHRNIKHPNIVIMFTPDEEIGRGVAKANLTYFSPDYAYTVDGGGLGELEFENFNAASARLDIKGVSIHTGDAKDKMINAVRVGIMFDNYLSQNMRPEYTCGREGFYHLCMLNGVVGDARAEYLIRNHDKAAFEKMKEDMVNTASLINKRFGDEIIKLKIEDTYKNMREVIEPEYMFLIDKAKAYMEELGIECIIKPIRGGTDGAGLSFKGIPCPNLFTGGENYHGVYEYICIESMEMAVKLLIKLATSNLRQ